MNKFWLSIDPILIYPYKLLGNQALSFWFGCLVLAFICIILGRLTVKALYALNKGFYQKQNAELEHYQHLSIKAANTGNQETYKAVNRMANESFGKTFFTGAALFTASLWPLPFIMHWLSARFEGVVIHTIPFLEKEVGYAFVMLACYVPLRLILSKLFP